MIVLRAEIELEAGKIRLLALEIAFHGGDGRGHLRRGRAGFYAGARRSNSRFVASGLLVGNWKRVLPTLFQAMPQKLESGAHRATLARHLAQGFARIRL
jgi:hypothetical protein